MTNHDHYCFIVHSVQPYCFDFIQIFALPSGFLYRHRYDEKWVSQALSENLEQLIGKKVLVLFWEISEQHVYPVRWGTIKTAKKVGRICYFEYELEELVTYAQTSQARKELVNEFTKSFKSLHVPKILENGHLATSVLKSQIGNALRKSPFDDIANWGNSLDAVSTSAVFEGVEFLKLLDITDGNGREIIPEKGAFYLNNGFVYKVRIFQFVANPGSGITPPHDVVLNSFADQIEILRRYQRAVGKYDVLTFLFRVRNVSAGEQTALEVLPNAPTDGLTAQYQSIYIPIVVKQPGFLRAFLRISVLVASIVLVFVPNIIPTEPQWVSSLGMIGFVIALVGGRSVARLFEPFRTLYVQR